MWHRNMRLLTDPFFGLVNYTIFGVSEEHLIHVSRLPAICVRNLLSILDTLAFTDRGYTNSTFLEERNLAASRETVESTIMTCPGQPGALRIKEEALEETNIGGRAISVKDQLHQETTKSHGSQPISMTTTSHQVFPCTVGVLRMFQCHWEPGDVIPMLMSDPGSILHEARNLQSLMISTRCKTTLKPRRSQNSK